MERRVALLIAKGAKVTGNIRALAEGWMHLSTQLHTIGCLQTRFEAERPRLTHGKPGPCTHLARGADRSYSITSRAVSTTPLCSSRTRYKPGASPSNVHWSCEVFGCS